MCLLINSNMDVLKQLIQNMQTKQLMINSNMDVLKLKVEAVFIRK